MVFANKQKIIQTQIGAYYKTVMDCMEAFKRAMINYCDDSDVPAMKESFDKVHAAENAADDIRRDVEVLMYSKALFPESRGDILGLLEAMDRVPNHAESSVHMVYLQHIKVPPAFAESIKQLTEVSYRCVKALVESAEKLFTDYTGATVGVGKINELESEADRIEADIIEQVFASDLPDLDKILLRDLTRHLAGISDRAENVGDRIRVIVAKRGI